MKPTIELAQPRDFSQIINDTFTFVKQNFKPLLKCFFVFCGFFLLASALFACLQQVQTIDTFNQLNGFGTERATTFSAYKFFSINFWLTMLFLLLTYFVMQLTILCYIMVYKEKGNVPPEVNEVWGYIKYYFMRTLGAWIVSAILTMIGFVFCVVPGLWLYPIMSLVVPIMIFENTTFGYAFNHSFRLIKENWWVTFGVIIVTAIIVYFMAMVVVLPASVANAITLFTNIKHGFHFSVGITIATVVLQHIAYIFYLIPYIAIALCYFNLTEVKEGTGMLNRIQHFGQDEFPPKTDPEEQY